MKKAPDALSRDTHSYPELTDSAREGAAARHSLDPQLQMIALAACERPVFISDEEDRIVFWSNGAEKYLGFSFADARGKTLRALAGDDAFDTARITVPTRASPSDARVTVRLRHKNRDILWCALSSDSVKNEHGETFFVNFLTDHTEAKSREDALRASNDNRDRILANVSHELRTPLSAILLWSQLFEEQAQIDPLQLREGLEVICKSAAEQREIIEDLLDVVRINQGKLRLERVSADLKAETNAALAIGRIAAKEKRIHLTEHVADNLGVADVDPHRWKQIIWNLLSNAVKFTPANGRVDVSVTRSGEMVHVRVSDTGKGIAADYLPFIFERFGQADSSTKRAHSGLGLGLGITRELVKLHGGSISAESGGHGTGAAFSVRIKLPKSEPLSNPPASSAYGISNRLKGVKILVVEDSSETRNALAAVLFSAGAVVSAVADAEAAVAEFRSNPPDLIVSDLCLPHTDGHELIKKIRATEATLRMPATPALLLTAYAAETESRRALHCGFSRRLVKPVEPRELIKTLREMLPDAGEKSVE